MRVLVAGASGLIGSRLLAALEAAGHQAGRLVRDQARAGGTNFFWNPEAGELDRAALADCDAIVNLAGESIVGRWMPPRSSGFARVASPPRAPSPKRWPQFKAARGFSSTPRP